MGLRRLFADNCKSTEKPGVAFAYDWNLDAWNIHNCDDLHKALLKNLEREKGYKEELHRAALAKASAMDRADERRESLLKEAKSAYALAVVYEGLYFDYRYEYKWDEMADFYADLTDTWFGKSEDLEAEAAGIDPLYEYEQAHFHLVYVNECYEELQSVTELFGAAWGFLCNR